MEEHWHMLKNPRATADPERYQTRPREFLRSGRWFVSTEPEEDDLAMSLDWIGEDSVVFASDYPHTDSSWPESVRIMRARQDISETAKRKILGENALRLYPALRAAIGTLAMAR
jgi:predicted TIM-barrel fold metal-dependent hydrolase